MSDAINETNVVHIYDAGFPLCYTENRDNPGPLWRKGPMVRQHMLANCPDCLGTRLVPASLNKET
jgi:hypothetical protein